MPRQISPLLRTAFQVLIVVILSCPSLMAAPGTDCVAKQQALTSAKSRIKADQNSIRQLNAGATASDLEKWANAADEERREVVKDSIVNSLGIVADGLMVSTDAAKDAVKPMNIVGIYLPHGVGSLGTGQANLIIGRLQRLGSTSPQVQTLIDNVRVLSSFQNKTETLEFAAKVHGIASAYKEGTDFGENLKGALSSDPVKVAAAGLQLVSGLAGKGATISVDVGEALFTGIEHLTDAYLISSIINNLSNPSGKQDITEAQLASLKALARKLEHDVKAFHDAEAQMGNCQSCEEDREAGRLDGTWNVPITLEGTDHYGRPFSPMEGLFFITKSGHCAYRLDFDHSGGECPPPINNIVAIGPTTYSGKADGGNGCLPQSIVLDVQGDSLSVKWINYSMDGTNPSTSRGIGHRVTR